MDDSKWNLQPPMNNCQNGQTIVEVGIFAYLVKAVTLSTSVAHDHEQTSGFNYVLAKDNQKITQLVTL